MTERHCSYSVTWCACVCPGVHLIEVLYDDVPVPKSPFRVSVAEGCDPSRVRAYGPGLEEGLVNKSNCFTVETRYIFYFDLLLSFLILNNITLKYHAVKSGSGNRF